MAKPRIVILAEPNGAGKSTLAKYLLPAGADILEFVNADQIAAGLSGFAPETVAFEAGRVMLARIQTLLQSKKSFAFETTLSSKSFAKLTLRAQSVGYLVDLIYVALPSPSHAKRRVLARVRKGGHSIHADVIERRFYRSLWNLQNIYLPVVDAWWVYDNAFAKTPRLIARGTRNNIQLIEEKLWLSLTQLAKKKK
jgi:predicted ABC-type ATPase